MAKVPTYQDLARQREESARVEQQVNLKDNVQQAGLVDAETSKNPVLQQYMNQGQSQQGLTPVEQEPDQYSMFATKVADMARDQDEYSRAMRDLAINGEVPAEGVLSDESVLPEYRQSLINTIEKSQQPQGLGGL